MLDLTPIRPSMYLITSSWRNQKTFKLIPLETGCPYNECIFDPDATSLAVVSREKKENYHMLPKINDFGDLVEVKNKKRPSGKDYAEQRVLLDTYYEYYLEEKEEIKTFIKMFAVNADTFDYQTTVDAAFKEEEAPLAEVPQA